jgi:hypothetical protein
MDMGSCSEIVDMVQLDQHSSFILCAIFRTGTQSKIPVSGIVFFIILNILIGNNCVEKGTNHNVTLFLKLNCIVSNYKSKITIMDMNVTKVKVPAPFLSEQPNKSCTSKGYELSFCSISCNILVYLSKFYGKVQIILHSSCSNQFKCRSISS